MQKIALTGHTSGLGLKIFNILSDRGHEILGFSRSAGHDLRDYSQVGDMIESIQNFDWFINCAHPDYCQTQILYRLLKNQFGGKILNIGSPVVHNMPEWQNLELLEYVTQKTALWHAHTTLTKIFPNKLILWEPAHVDNSEHVKHYLTGLGL